MSLKGDLMKISKFVVVALFAAGFITTSASASYATSCAVGYTAVENANWEDGMYSCELESEIEILYTEPKPVDSCWETPEGGNVCARGAVAPEPYTTGEEVPMESTSYCMPEEGEDACYDTAVPYESTLEDGSVTRDGEQVETTVDETLMYQSGVAMPASGSEPSSSNMLAAVGVLVGALGALGIGISRQREAK